MTFNQDEYYIGQVLEGNLPAFRVLVEKHKNMAFSIALKIVRNREDAEEITQDAFLKAYQSMKSFRKESKFSTWLYRIVYNHAISKTRLKRLETTLIEEDMIENYSEDEIHTDLYQFSEEEQTSLITGLLNELPEQEYLLINLYYMNGNSMEEISEITGLTVSNVKVKLHRLRKKIFAGLQHRMEKIYSQ